jgi:CubicO group peptidase (beta-lactamase class C family)
MKFRPFAFVAFLLLTIAICPTARTADLAADDLRGIDQLVNRSIERKELAGAVVLVAHRGKTVYLKTFGHQDVESSKPMTEQTIFRIASMTKPVTSVAIMMLADEGKLAPSDPLSKFLPEFKETKVLAAAAADASAVPARRDVTIHDLLTHTSGITYGFHGHDLATRYRSAGVVDGLSAADITLAENCARIAKLPLANHPGAAWEYGLNTDVLGRVVEVASGMPLDEFFQRRIFEPLKMNDTHFLLPEEKWSRLAALYTPDAGQKIQRVGKEPVEAGTVRFSAVYPMQQQNKYRSGGAGLVSTITDYARFLNMLLNNGTLDGVRLLNPETVALMTKNQIGDLNIAFAVHGTKFGYGVGVVPEGADRANEPSSPGSCSWGGIFHTFFWVDPREQLVGIYMTQLFPFNHLDHWARFKKLTYDALRD